MTEKNRFRSAIIKFVTSSDNYQPVKARKLAKMMAVEERYYKQFTREIASMVKDSVLSELAGGRISLPDMPRKLTGIYRFNQRGFGFILPDDPNRHGDLFIPPGDNMDAMNGDRVSAEVSRGGMRDGQMRFRGRVTEIIERAAGRFVGVLVRDDRMKSWSVSPQGKAMREAIIVLDIPPGARSGDRVVVEITRYPEMGRPAAGVILETLEAPTESALEMLAIIREFDIPSEFPDAVHKEAREITDSFDTEAIPSDRDDLTGIVTITVDPDDARDFDDAVSIEKSRENLILGVHIADVSSFVTQGSALDAEACLRGNSTYLPRCVVPMLPEILSNGLCSLQADRLRWVKTAFIEYDAEGKVVATRFSNGVIRSRQRLTYKQAQGILDGKIGGYDSQVVQTVQDMDRLARIILKRRRGAGMIHLDLPETEIIFDDDGNPHDIQAADESFTHRIIEMFMVEANEAVARLLDDQTEAFIRRIHPVSPGVLAGDSANFIKACGLKVPSDLSRHDLQALVEQVRGRPESYPVNLALLKTLEQAEYSIAPIGHYALASECYCHFTSPIRRYADLCVHRQLDNYLRSKPEQEGDDLSSIARNCNITERRSVGAEREARMLITLLILREHVGEVMDAVVSSVVASGLFAEILQYQVEGLIKLEDIGEGGGRWASDPRNGVITESRSGQRLSLGQPIKVRILAVDLQRRRLDLLAEEFQGEAKATKSLKSKNGSKGTIGGRKPKIASKSRTRRAGSGKSSKSATRSGKAKHRKGKGRKK